MELQEIETKDDHYRPVQSMESIALSLSIDDGMIDSSHKSDDIQVPTVDRDVMIKLLTALAIKYCFPEGDLNRDRIMTILIQVPQSELVKLVDELGLNTRAFAESRDVNWGRFTQYMLLRNSAFKVTDAIANFVLETCGFEPVKPIRDLNEIIAQIIKRQPKAVIMINLIGDRLQLLKKVLWILHETEVDVIIVGCTQQSAPDIFLNQPWFYNINPVTSSKDCNNVAITIFASTLSFKSKIPIIFLSEDSFLKEASLDINRLSGNDAYCIDTNDAFIMPFLKIFPGRLSKAAERLKSGDDFQAIRKDFPLVPDIAILPAVIIPVEKPEPIKVDITQPFTIDLSRCIAVVKSGKNKGKLCGRSIPCDYHSASMLPQLAKLSKQE